MDKNILACLEIADHELRLVVGQFFNSRLNILKVERISHEAILNQSITHETKIIELIQKMLENTSQNLGVKIEKVIALIPDLEVKHVNHQLRLTINGNISEEDIHQAYRSLQDNAVPDHKVLINTVVNRYFVNGIFTRKIPLNEKAANMTVDGDLYFADAKNVFAYIGAIEKAKLEVMDVVLSGLAFGKEASLYERSINTPIIAFNAGDYTSTLSLFYKGRLVESTHVPKGIYTFIERLYKELKIPTLDEYLRCCKRNNLIPVIEFKNININSVKYIIGKIKQEGLENNTIIISSNYKWVKYIRKYTYKIQFQYLADINLENINLIKQYGNYGIDVRCDKVTKDLVKLAHENGAKVNVWNVNTNEEVDKLLRFGVDMVTSNKNFN